MANCYDCKFFKIYRGSRDRFGVQQEPDDSECISDRATEEDIDKYYSDGVSWSNDEEGCAGYEPADYPDDYEY